MTNPLFWERLGHSGLMVPAAAHSMRSQFQLSLGNGVATQPSDAVAWLRKSGRISEFQGKLLLGGFDGSFSFGEYLLIARRPNIMGLATFAARHVPTQYEVQLCFVSGELASDVEVWDTIASRSNQLRNCRQPTLLRVHETVELMEYRFVVIDASAGLTLDERLGNKGRISWPTACALAMHLGQAVDEIHQHGLAHGNLNSREVFLEPSGFPRMAPPIGPTRLAQSTPEGGIAPAEMAMIAPDVRPEMAGAANPIADDVYSLATILFRAIRGETPTEYLAGLNAPLSDMEAAVAKLAKYEIPIELTSLLRRTLDRKSQNRIGTAADFLRQLGSIPQANTVKISPAAPSRSADDFSQWLRRWRPAVPDSNSLPTSVPIPSSLESAELGFSAIQSLVVVAATGPARRREKKSTRANGIIWTTCAAALIATLCGVYKWVGSPPPDRAIVATRSDIIESPALPNAVPISVAPPMTDNPNRSSAVVSGNWIQKIVEDNGQILWQSPTNGPTVDLSLVPPGASIIVVARPSALAQQPECSKISLALGSEFQAYLARLPIELSFPLESIDQLIVGLYPTEQQVYETFYRVRLVDPMQPAELLARWTANGFSADSTNAKIWTKNETAYGLRSASVAATGSASTAKNEALIGEFVCGSRENVESALLVNVANPLTGAMAQLIARTDRDRDLTIIGLKAGLFNELGQNLLPPRYRPLQRQFSFLVEDQVRALLFSFHLDDGMYAEMAFDETADMRSSALRDAVAAHWTSAREQLTEYVAALPADPYWEKVRQRYDDMLTDVSRHLRIGVEFDQVLLNLWLPTLAAHNLVAASELTLSADPGSTSAVANKPNAPTDIQQLLQIRRTLQNDNPPDLNILIDTLQTEIRDDFPNLPFAFEIRLSNTDLREGGITRNQRLSALALVDQTLDQVLTRICFQANPDKNASGPEDPRCTLIWVVTRDNEKNADLVLITTRAAAAKNGWQLPASFAPKTP